MIFHMNMFELIGRMQACQSQAENIFANIGEIVDSLINISAFNYPESDNTDSVIRDEAIQSVLDIKSKIPGIENSIELYKKILDNYILDIFVRDLRNNKYIDSGYMSFEKQDSCPILVNGEQREISYTVLIILEEHDILNISVDISVNDIRLTEDIKTEITNHIIDNLEKATGSYLLSYLKLDINFVE